MMTSSDTVETKRACTLLLANKHAHTVLLLQSSAKVFPSQSFCETFHIFIFVFWMIYTTQFGYRVIILRIYQHMVQILTGSKGGSYKSLLLVSIVCIQFVSWINALRITWGKKYHLWNVIYCCGMPRFYWAPGRIITACAAAFLLMAPF
jgi:uncharacterized membrane protein YjgN (DUF898 family)